MPLAYATADDLRERLSLAPEAPLPANGQAMLDTANGLVTQAIKNSRFDVDVDGFPAPAEKKSACTEAALRQVSTWLSTGVSPFDGGPAGKPQTVQSKSALGTSATFAADGQADHWYALLAAGTDLIPWAAQALDAEGLREVHLVRDGWVA